MKKYIPVLLSLLLLSGCGGGGGEETPQSTANSSSVSNTNVTAVNNTEGKTSGQYNLWSYMTPTSSTTNSFVEQTNSGSSTYTTTYTTTGNTVTEVSDYAENESTTYTKKADRIAVAFEKDGTANGSYDLDLTADIGDVVTVKDSNCILTAHFDTKTINEKTFNDVIEIQCASKPGYYAKGMGEVAQLDRLTVSGSTTITIRSN
ncbi:MAG: hypothetical protein K0U47_08830 [Epsilonproteobacteria bacterium]|nr:hypothetical protein [Campylobacterota bacterium]